MWTEFFFTFYMDITFGISSDIVRYLTLMLQAYMSIKLPLSIKCLLQILEQKRKVKRHQLPLYSRYPFASHHRFEAQLLPNTIPYRQSRIPINTFPPPLFRFIPADAPEAVGKNLHPPLSTSYLHRTGKRQRNAERVYQHTLQLHCYLSARPGEKNEKLPTNQPWFICEMDSKRKYKNIEKWLGKINFLGVLVQINSPWKLAIKFSGSGEGLWKFSLSLVRV